MRNAESETCVQDSIEMESIEDSYPLSSLQHGMLFHSLYNPSAGVDFEQMIITLLHDVNISCIQQAWLNVIRRHTVLRTGFRWDGLEPRQEVFSDVEPAWQVFDWRELDRPDREARLEQFLCDDRRAGFDMRRPPLLRFALFRIDESEYRLVWSFHHAILDGRAFVIVLKEVFAFYQSLSNGNHLHLAPPRQFRDYISWLERVELSAAEKYWSKTLAGVETTTPLSAVFSTGLAAETYALSSQEMRLSATTTAAIQELATRYDITPNTIIQGAWAVLLSRYTGNSDVVFGVTRACRKSAMGGADDVVGLFINTLPLRVKIPESGKVMPWLADIRADNIDVRPYEHTPLVAIRQWCQSESNTPLFDSILVFENFLLDTALREPGGDWERRRFELRGKTNYPLTVGAYLDTELLIRITHYTRWFSNIVIARMLGHLRTVIEAIVADPMQNISRLPLLTKVEEQEILLDYNDSSSDLSQIDAVHHLFEEAACISPNAIALVFEDQQLTYHQVNSRANQLAHYLRARGVGPDVLVGLCIERSAAMVVGMLGILKAGGAYVPLDTDLPKDRLGWMIEDCSAHLLLTEKRWADTGDRPDRVICLDTDASAIDQESDENLESGVCSHHLVYAIYTSGSTGHPKCVGIEHRQLLNYVQGISRGIGLGPGASYATVSTFAADLGNTAVFPSLCGGGCLHVLSSERAMDPDRWREYFTRHTIDCLKIVPSHLSALLSGGGIEAVMLPRRVLVLGGEASHWELVDQILEAAPLLQVLNHYGPTETTVGVLTYTIKSSSRAEQPSSATVPLGRPLSNSRTYVLNEQRQLVPVGVPGELYIGGAGVSRGYLNRPDLTADKFVLDPFCKDAGARMYRTGDLARYLPEGDLEFLGRIDHQVKVRGYRIELGEIESVLLQHPAVREVSVLARQETSTDLRLVAYVVPGDKSPTAGDLRTYLKTLLPEYMIPSAFVFLEALPLTPNGKVDRKALPPPTGNEQDVAKVAPRTPLEEALAEIWCEVLGFEHVGAHDSFFALGGHSLLATQVISRIRKVWQVELSVRVVFAGANSGRTGRAH